VAQFLDVLESARGWDELSTDQRVARARTVIRYKSAKYTIEHPLLIGGLGRGVSPSEPRGALGLRTGPGEAFQLRDDLLGSSETPHIRASLQVMTCVKASALSWSPWPWTRPSPSNAALFDKLLGAPDLDEPGVDELRATIMASGPRTE